MAPPPPHGTGRAPRQGPLSGFAEAAGTRVLAAARDQLLEDLVRGHDRLESARAVLSFTTELVARSHDALARSIAILAPKARRVRSVPGAGGIHPGLEARQGGATPGMRPGGGGQQEGA